MPSITVRLNEIGLSIKQLASKAKNALVGCFCSHRVAVVNPLPIDSAIGNLMQSAAKLEQVRLRFLDVRQDYEMAAGTFVRSRFENSPNWRYPLLANNPLMADLEQKYVAKIHESQAKIDNLQDEYIQAKIQLQYAENVAKPYARNLVERLHSERKYLAIDEFCIHPRY